jgi:hypothetical protein
MGAREKVSGRRCQRIRTVKWVFCPHAAGLRAIGTAGVRVYQRRSGYRFTLEAVLLAHFAATEGGEARTPMAIPPSCSICSRWRCCSWGAASRKPRLPWPGCAGSAISCSPSRPPSASWSCGYTRESPRCCASTRRWRAWSRRGRTSSAGSGWTWPGTWWCSSRGGSCHPGRGWRWSRVRCRRPPVPHRTRQCPALSSARS